MYLWFSSYLNETRKNLLHPRFACCFDFLHPAAVVIPIQWLYEADVWNYPGYPEHAGWEWLIKWPKRNWYNIDSFQTLIIYNKKRSCNCSNHKHKKKNQRSQRCRLMLYRIKFFVHIHYVCLTERAESRSSKKLSRFLATDMFPKKSIL